MNPYQSPTTSDTHHLDYSIFRRLLRVLVVLVLGLIPGFLVAAHTFCKSVNVISFESKWDVARSFFLDW